MLRGIIKGDHSHPVQGRDPVAQFLGRLIGNIGDHHLRRTDRGEIGVHGINALSGLRIFRKIFGHIIFHLHPVHGEDAENKGTDIQQEKQIPLIYYKGGDF